MDKKYRAIYKKRALEQGLCMRCYIRPRSANLRSCAGCRTRANHSTAEWRRKNPEKSKAISAACEARRPGRFAENRRRYYLRLRDAVFKKYGDKCVRCGFSDRRALQIDHINGGGTQERAVFLKSANSYWRHVLNDETGKYQLLCANCNSIKMRENGEFYKHGREAE